VAEWEISNENASPPICQSVVIENMAKYGCFSDGLVRTRDTKKNKLSVGKRSRKVICHESAGLPTRK
jgi:hypothetical protein